MKNLLIFLLLFSPFFLFAQSDTPQTGFATYYAKKFDGHRTSSGEKFSNKKLTGAHHSLPYGTKVKVTNLSNNKSVIVTINDRPPKKSPCAIDLSQEAAKELGFMKAGRAKVKIEVLK